MNNAISIKRKNMEDDTSSKRCKITNNYNLGNLPVDIILIIEQYIRNMGFTLSKINKQWRCIASMYTDRFLMKINLSYICYKNFKLFYTDFPYLFIKKVEIEDICFLNKINQGHSFYLLELDDYEFEMQDVDDTFITKPKMLEIISEKNQERLKINIEAVNQRITDIYTNFVKSQTDYVFKVLDRHRTYFNIMMSIYSLAFSIRNIDFEKIITINNLVKFGKNKVNSLLKYYVETDNMDHIDGIEHQDIFTKCIHIALKSGKSSIAYNILEYVRKLKFGDRYTLENNFLILSIHYNEYVSFRSLTFQINFNDEIALENLLAEAFRSRSIGIIKYLIRHKATIKQQTTVRSIITYVTMYFRYKKTLDSDINKEIFPLLLSCTDNQLVYNSDIFKIIYENADSYLTKKFIEHGFKVKNHPGLVGYFIYSSNIQMIEYLITKNATVKYKNQKFLFDAIYHNNYELTKFFLDKGCSASIRRNRPILQALQQKNVDIIELLLEYDADPTVNNNILLNAAICTNNIRLLKLLIKYGVDLTTNNNALKSAIRLKYYKIVDIILDRIKDDVIFSTDECSRIFTNAIKTNNSDIVNSLLRVFNTSFKDNYIHFLYTAIDKDNIDILQTLLHEDFYKLDNEIIDILIYAIKHNKNKSLTFLLENRKFVDENIIKNLKYIDNKLFTLAMTHGENTKIYKTLLNFF
ncbi:MAG: ankyrin repeat domain-containing protein [Cetobacterium sp.]